MNASMRHVFNLGVVVLLAFYVVTAFGYNSQARFMPLFIGIPVLILAIIQTILDFIKYRNKTMSARKGKKPATLEPPATERAVDKKELTVCIWVVSMFVSLYLIGFVATTFIYTFLSLKVRSRFSWKSSLGVSSGSLVFLYVVLIQGLHVSLYPGFITLILRKALYGY